MLYREFSNTTALKNNSWVKQQIPSPCCHSDEFIYVVTLQPQGSSLKPEPLLKIFFDRQEGSLIHVYQTQLQTPFLLTGFFLTYDAYESVKKVQYFLWNVFNMSSITIVKYTY